MIAREDLMIWELGAHGSTYGGSPVPCAAALATLRRDRGGGLDGQREGASATCFLAGLRDIASRHPIITDVRGRALWIGLTFADHDQAAAIEQASFRKGLLILGCGDDDVRMSRRWCSARTRRRPRSRSSRRSSPRSSRPAHRAGGDGA